MSRSRRFSGNNRSPFRTACAVAGLAVACAATGGAARARAEQSPQALTMALSATVSTPRSDVVVKARVEPDERSRELIIEWVADDLSGGSTMISLEGERAARSHRFTLKHLTPGRYTVTATLRRNDGTQTRSERNLWVVGIGDPAVFAGGGPRGSSINALSPALHP